MAKQHEKIIQDDILGFLMSKRVLGIPLTLLRQTKKNLLAVSNHILIVANRRKVEDGRSHNGRWSNWSAFISDLVF